MRGRRFFFYSLLITDYLLLKYGDAFDLDLGTVFEQAFDFDERHGRVIGAHLLAPALSYLRAARPVFFLVRDVNDQACDAARGAPRLVHDREQITQGTVEL